MVNKESKLNLKAFVEGVGGVVAIAITILLSPILRRWYSRWGATDAEVKRSFPGDEAVRHPKSELTCAITIHAPAVQVWPWFVQLGCQRGGWYSYDLLDNGGIPSADRIIPEYQHLEVGDMLPAVPNGSFGFPVAGIEWDKTLTLAGTLNTSTGKLADPNPVWRCKTVDEAETLFAELGFTSAFWNLRQPGTT